MTTPPVIPSPTKSLPIPSFLYHEGMQKHIPLVRHHTPEFLKEILKKTVEPLFKTRLKGIILRMEDKNPQEIAKQLMVSSRSVTHWILLYSKGGLTTLKIKPSGRPEGNPTWPQDIFDSLSKEIDKGGYWSIPRMQEWITDTFGKTIPEQTVWYRMDKLKYSYKSSRPNPVKGDKERRETFKKGASRHFWSR
jgi:transposase